MDPLTVSKASVRIRAFANQNYTNWDTILFGIPYTPEQGKEVIMQWYTPNINNLNVSYTDSNGLEMQRRVKDKRPDYNYTTHQSVASNYYPINSAIAIVDEKNNLQLTVMNDRSQGGASISNGQIELMQNRRLYYDDDRGVEEALNETDAFGNGIVTHNSYKVHFFNRTKEASQ